MKIAQGKVVADSGAYVGVVEASSGVILEEKNTGVFVIPTNSDPSKIDFGVAGQIGYTNNGTTITPNADKAEKSYYVIDSGEALSIFVSKWNSGDAAYQSIKLIKLVSNVTYDYSTNPWTPLGTWAFPFNGSIDGMGCTIKGLGVNQTTPDAYATTGTTSGISGYAYGFIGIAGNGDVEVKNINFVDLSITYVSGNMVGTVIGFAPSNSKFTKSNEDGDKATNGKWSGNTTIGKGNISISNITVSGSISAKQDVAGIIGKAYNEGNLTISNCTNNATLVESASNGRAAGIVAYVSGSSNVFVTNCHNNGKIKSHFYMSGILSVGFSDSKAMSLTVNNCSNSGKLYTDRISDWDTAGNIDYLVSIAGTAWASAATGSKIDFSVGNANTGHIYLGMDETSAIEVTDKVRLINLTYADSSGDNVEYNGKIETK